MAQPGPDMMSDLKVTRQSTKIAISPDGVITYRDGYGKGTDQTWREVFEDLGAR